MKVILLGPPGAGKGTQAANVAEHLGVPKVASGDLFRDNTRRGTELGQLADSYMKKGALVPDDVTIRMVMDWIATEAKGGGFLLDGFPRTLGQAEALDIELNGAAIDRVLYVRVSEEELIRRLTGRVVCRKCGHTYHKIFNPPLTEGECGECGSELYERDDDKPEPVKKRLEVFFAQTAPLIDYYQNKDLLKEIDGEQSIEAVGQALIGALG